MTAASVARGDRRLERSEVFQPRSGLLGRAEHYRDGVLDYALRRTPSRRLAHLHAAVLCGAAGETERAFQHLESAIDATQVFCVSPSRRSGTTCAVIQDSIGAWRGWDWLPATADECSTLLGSPFPPRRGLFGYR